MSNGHDHNEGRNLKLAFFVNTAFTLLELVGGLWTHSLAILSDALHDLGDSISLAMAWYFQRLSTRKADAQFTYGYRRFSVIGALINGLILFSGSILIIYHAIPRIIQPEETHSEGMFVLALLGIAVNGAAAFRLKENSSINSKVARLHLLEDVLGWVAVLIGAVVIHFTDWYVVDGILSMGIATYILYNVVRQLKQIIRVMLQTVPDGLQLDQIKEAMCSVSGVMEVHDLRLWTLDGEHNILTAHVVVDAPDLNAHTAIRQQIKESVRSFSIIHCTLELEGPNDCSPGINE